MNYLLTKLNYRSQPRIALLNADDDIYRMISEGNENLIIDKEVDLRYPYEFMILFVKKASEVEILAPLAIHNLVADGILWFCYPKKSSPRFKSDIDRDHGWNSLNESGLHGIRIVSVNDDWSALRFRNAKFIKSAKPFYTKP